MHRISSLTFSLFMLVISACAPRQAYKCPTTEANGATPPGEASDDHYHGNGKLWTALWPEGELTFEPDGPGEVRPDGSLAMKFPWWRGEGIVGPIDVSGRRLDQPGSGVFVEIPDGYGDTGFQASALVFPSEGCWEVTASAGGEELTFVVNVQRSE